MIQTTIRMRIMRIDLSKMYMRCEEENTFNSMSHNEREQMFENAL